MLWVSNAITLHSVGFEHVHTARKQFFRKISGHR
jgi:predicted membrane protein